MLYLFINNYNNQKIYGSLKIHFNLYCNRIPYGIMVKEGTVVRGNGFQDINAINDLVRRALILAWAFNPHKLTTLDGEIWIK